MKFNPATAKPVVKSGFNPLTAKPIVPENPDAMGTIKELSPFEMTMQKYGIPALKGLQLAGGLTPISPITTGLTEGAIKSAQGAEPMEALKQGGIAGGVDLGLTLGTMGLGKIPGVKNAIKSAVSPVGEFLTGIPKDAYRRVLDNPKLLKGKFNAKEAFAGLGKGLSEAVEKTEESLGKNVGEAKISALKNVDKINKENITPIIQSMKESRALLSPKGKMSAIDEGDIARIDEVQKALSKSKNMNDIALIVESLRGDLKYGSTRTPTGQGILKKVQGKLTKLLPEDLKNANKQYSEYQGLLKDIGENSLGEQNVETLVRNLPNKTLARQEAIGKLGKLSGTDIGEQQKNIWARDMFENIVPAKGYTSGGNQGMGNIARTAVISALGGSGNIPAAIGTSSFFSPLMHKYAIKYGIPTAKAGAKLAKPQLATMIADMIEEKTGGK